MRFILGILVGIGVGLWSTAAFAQLRADGQVYALVYARENLAGTQLWDAYQGLQVRVRPSANLSFRTNLRLARRGDPADWAERVYNAYADWQTNDRQLRVRLGRQFLYRGVLNGSLDALSVRAFPAKGLELQVVGGVAVPFDRPLDVQSWSDGGVLGGYAAYQIAPSARVDLSYMQRTRQDELAWQQVGGALTGAWRGRLSYLAQLEYNLQQSTYQGMRYRLTYQLGRWALTGEFNSQKPRVLEDSFFNVFELVAFDQGRGGLTYQVGRYVVGVQYIHTLYERDETNDEFMLTVGSGWGTVGVVYQTGFGGDNVGLYGEARYDLRPDLTVRASSSHYTYERRNISFDEDATAFSGGLVYRPLPALSLQAEVQESMNSRFDNDLRALFRVTYAFRYR